VAGSFRSPRPVPGRRPNQGRRLAFVVHRYGRGGAERLCQALAERLAARHDVTVLTTCALDNATWANALPRGESVERGVRVRRFPTVAARGPDYGELSDHVLGGAASPEEQLRWLRAHGPHAPALIDELERGWRGYDALFFVTYLSESTVLGARIARDRTVLIPTAHAEPPLRLGVMGRLFHAPRHIVYLAPAERRLVEALWRNQAVPSSTCAIGLDPPPAADGARFRARHAIEGDLLVYVGRVEPGKGCDELVEWVRGHRRAGQLTLALLGSDALGLRRAGPILPLGYVDEATKHDALAAADLFVMPSPTESLSIVTLEAGQHGRAVLVNERSAVLRDHVVASQGGLFYGGRADFAAGLEWLLDHPEERRRMGRNGRAHVATICDWPTVDAEYERIVAAVAGG
jgi:glycosyltransferase involved in cell wall biosynthesis